MDQSKELTVGQLREQSALTDANARVVLVVEGPNNTAAAGVRVTRCYPDTVDEYGRWKSTFKIAVEDGEGLRKAITMAERERAEPSWRHGDFDPSEVRDYHITDEAIKAVLCDPDRARRLGVEGIKRLALELHDLRRRTELMRELAQATWSPETVQEIARRAREWSSELGAQMDYASVLILRRLAGMKFAVHPHSIQDLITSVKAELAHPVLSDSSQQPG